MKTYKCGDVTEAKMKLQQILDTYEKGYSQRSWLIGSPPDTDGEYRVEIMVLEGSPPKMFAVLTDWYGRGTIYLMTTSCKRVAEIYFNTIDSNSSLRKGKRPPRIQNTRTRYSTDGKAIYTEDGKTWKTFIK